MDASSIRAALVRLGFALGRLTPLRPRVVLATSHADHLSGNLATIDARLRGRLVRVGTPPIRPVVLTQRQGRGLAARLAAVLGAVAAGFQLATARLFIVDDYFFPMYVVRPRPGTRFVQVWHGCGALKKMGYSSIDTGFGRDEAFAERFRIHSNYDLILVSSMAVAPYYAEAFHQPLERFTSRLGIPRTDVLLEPGREQRAEAVRDWYPAQGKRVILYAPTFRGARGDRASSPAYLDLAVMREVLGDDHVVLVRAHPFVRDAVRIGPELAGFAIDASGFPDINELMLIADVFVTDYSSAVFEFALLERPIAMFAPDLAEYEAERGLYIDYRATLPGPVFASTRELAEHLRRGEFDLAAVRRIRDWAFDVADGRATSRFIDEVVLPALA
jgi:CDP-glycerol glycerophosphotransferase (TagB/SpsB family)